MAEEHNTEFFKTFLQDRGNEHLKIRLDNALQSFASGNDYMFFICLRVEAADARTEATFGSATCKVAAMGIEARNRKYMAPVGCFFLTGYKILQDFLADTPKKPKVPADHFQRKALQCFLQYLSSDHSVLAKRTEDECEAVIARRYAEHLLMLLCDQKKYVIDSYPGLQYVKCCDKEHSYSGNCGDTSFGLEDGWHGKANLLIANSTDIELPVFFGKSTEDDVSVSALDKDSDEKNIDNDYTQMVAETLVFSFLQHRQNPVTMNNFLIPCLGIKNEKIIVFMYDCVNDVLLATHELELFDEEYIDIRTIILLWLILNYRLFCTGLIDEFKQYLSDFHTLLADDYLQHYRHGVTMPCHTMFTQKRNFNPSKSDVAPVLEKRLKISNLPEIFQWEISDE